ncbi:MAG: Crp/Fnr family transcriptional regulator [Moheibacter sp.]
MFDELKTYFQEKSVQLSPEVVNMIDQNLERRLVKKNEILLHEGENCSHTFFVAKGLLRAYTMDEQGKEHILQFAPENWLISDRSSVLFNEVSEQYIDAIEDSEVILIESGFFEKLSEISSDFQRFNMNALNNHIRHLQKRINLLISATAEVRYLDFVKLYPNILLRVPQLMVASYLGITPESLSRVRKELARKNFKTN